VQRSVRVSGVTFALEAPTAAVISDMLNKAPTTLIHILCIGQRGKRCIRQIDQAKQLCAASISGAFPKCSFLFLDCV